MSPTALGDPEVDILPRFGYGGCWEKISLWLAITVTRWMKSGSYHDYQSKYQATSVDIPSSSTMSRQSLEDIHPLLLESTTSGGLEKEHSSNVEHWCRRSCCRIPLMALLAVSVLLNVALIVRPMYPGRRCASDQKVYSRWNGS